MGTAIAVGGLFFLSDWEFGIHIFPRMLSLARSREEEHTPERMLYSPRLAGMRYGLIAMGVLTATLGSMVLPDAEWPTWILFGCLPLYWVVLFIHGRRAIMLAGDQIARNDRALARQFTDP